ncbi:MAG TPA: 6-pyruvoyl-tetrahydropterin synthase-related protein [Methanobacteriaceae archaeon]|nr:6-pyruvoyl-tetrahydropterin synthase-related protein [Methanobacteriaceae archaeon]
MDISTNFTKVKRILLLTPAILALCIALLPTLKYQLPLSLDIYFHVHMAELYLQQGLTQWDPLTFAPRGRPIYYPPLFHLLLAFSNYIVPNNLLNVARFLQPFLAFGVVLSFSYVAYKLYNITVGTISGFLIIMSLPFHRFMLPIPETLALIFFSLAVYLFYTALKDDKRKNGALAGILTGLAFLTHPSTALCLVLVLTVYTLILKFRKNEVKFYSFWIFLVCAAVIASTWWVPLIWNYGYQFYFPTVTVPISQYYHVFGILTLIMAPLGAYLAIKRRNLSDILVLTWFLSLMVFSQVYLLGVNILSDRILNFAVLPLVIIAGVGVDYIQNKNKAIFYILTIIIIISAIVSGFTAVKLSEPDPSPSQIDVAHWFWKNGDHNGVVLASDLSIEPVIVALSGQPVTGGGYGAAKIEELDRQKYMSFQFTLEDLKHDHVGYLVFNKNQENPPYSELVYQNQDYKIFRMKNM